VEEHVAEVEEHAAVASVVDWIGVVWDTLGYPIGCGEEKGVRERRRDETKRKNGLQLQLLQLQLQLHLQLHLRYMSYSYSHSQAIMWVEGQYRSQNKSTG